MPDSHAVCHYSIFQSQLSEMPQQGSRGITKPSCTEQRLYSTTLSVLFRFISPQQQIEGFEQLLRRLLKLPHQPAIVVVHWWSPVHDCSKSQQVSLSTQVIVLRPIFIAEEHKFVVYFLLSFCVLIILLLLHSLFQVAFYSKLLQHGKCCTVVKLWSMHVLLSGLQANKVM